MQMSLNDCIIQTLQMYQASNLAAAVDALLVGRYALEILDTEIHGQ
jgi:hypothetical protein